MLYLVSSSEWGFHPEAWNYCKTKNKPQNLLPWLLLITAKSSSPTTPLHNQTTTFTITIIISISSSISSRFLTESVCSRHRHPPSPPETTCTNSSFSLTCISYIYIYMHAHTPLIFVLFYFSIFCCRSKESGPYDLGEFDQALFLYLDGQDPSSTVQDQRRQFSLYKIWSFSFIFLFSFWVLWKLLQKEEYCLQKTIQGN